MPMPDINDLPENQIVLHFETNNVIEIAQLSALFYEFAAFARSDQRIGQDAVIVLLRLKSGSPTTTWIEILNAVGSAAGVGSFGIGLAAFIQEYRGRKLSRRLAELMFDNDVTDFTIGVRDMDGGSVRRISLAREDMPAVGALERERDLQRQRRIAAREDLQTEAVLARGPRLESVRLTSSVDPLSEEVELTGRIVTTHGGQFALFRTVDREYQIVSPRNLYETIPIGEDIIVLGILSGENKDSLQISDWHLASDENIDWENEEGLPGVQVEKLKSIQERSNWGQLDRSEAASPYPNDDDGEETRMRELLQSKGEDFVSFENTDTFVGRFEQDGPLPIFRTQAGTKYRFLGSKGRGPDREYAVRAQILEDDRGPFDWLHVMDVFPVHE